MVSFIKFFILFYGKPYEFYVRKIAVKEESSSKYTNK